MSRAAVEPLVVAGWRLYAHDLFLRQLEDLVEAVEAERSRDPEGYVREGSTKRLAAIVKLAFEVIPQDPTRPEYRVGSTLGLRPKHWFRAKFFQQYRLFFRFSVQERAIVFVWVNDEETKRSCDSRADAYRTFRKMLKSGNPPDDWDELVRNLEQNTERFRRAAGGR